MKKVRSIKSETEKSIETAPPLTNSTVAPVASPPLNDAESHMLRHLLRLKKNAEAQAKSFTDQAKLLTDHATMVIEQAEMNISDHVASVLKVRNLPVHEYGIAMSDQRTINKLDKPINVPEPAQK